MPEYNPTILIVEDDEEMAKLNARLLKRQGYQSLVAHTAAEARLLAAGAQPDLLIIDIGLPDGSGLALCEEFRLNSDAPVLFLTGKSEVSDKITGLEAGGDYYMTKPYDKGEFLAVVQSLLRRAGRIRKIITEASIIEKGSLTLKIDERKAYNNGRDAGLTPKEFAVLQILVQNEDKELAGEDIYTNVWGVPMNNDTTSIRVTISRLKRKLDEENASDFAIMTKYGGGYTFIMLT